MQSYVQKEFLTLTTMSLNTIFVVISILAWNPQHSKASNQEGNPPSIFTVNIQSTTTSTSNIGQKDQITLPKKIIYEERKIKTTYFTPKQGRTFQFNYQSLVADYDILEADIAGKVHKFEGKEPAEAENLFYKMSPEKRQKKFVRVTQFVKRSAFFTKKYRIKVNTQLYAIKHLMDAANLKLSIPNTTEYYEDLAFQLQEPMALKKIKMDHKLINPVIILDSYERQQLLYQIENYGPKMDEDANLAIQITETEKYTMYETYDPVNNNWNQVTTTTGGKGQVKRLKHNKHSTYYMTIRNLAHPTKKYSLPSITTKNLINFEKSPPLIAIAAGAIASKLAKSGEWFVSRASEAAKLEVSFSTPQLTKLPADGKKVNFDTHWHRRTIYESQDKTHRLKGILNSRNKLVNFKLIPAIGTRTIHPSSSHYCDKVEEKPFYIFCGLNRRINLVSKEPTKIKLRRIKEKEQGLRKLGKEHTFDVDSYSKSRIKRSTEVNLRTNRRPKLKRMLNVKNLLEAFVNGKLMKTIIQSDLGSDVLKMGGVAFKSLAFKAKKQLSSAGKKLSKGYSKAATIFMVRDFGKALRNGDLPTLAIMIPSIAIQLSETGIHKWVKANAGSSKAGMLTKVAKTLGVAGGLLGVGVDSYSVYQSHQCLNLNSQNQELCVRAEEGCLEEYNICNGRNAVAGVTFAYIQLGLSTVSLVAAVAMFVFPEAAIIAAVIVAVVSFVLGLAEQVTQSVHQIDNFSKYYPLTGWERLKQGYTVFSAGKIDHYLLEGRETARYNSQLLDQMGEYVLAHNESIWAYLSPAAKAYYAKNASGCSATRNVIDKIVHHVSVYSLFPRACEDAVASNFTYDLYPDNNIDLTQWSYRYFERWSPNPNEKTGNYKRNNFTNYNFFCRPQIENASDEVKTSWSSSNSFKCINAIGYKSQEPREDLYAFIDLQDGNDTAIGAITSPNFFLVGSGSKKFKGGPNKDLYLLQSQGDNVEGVFDGEEGDDTLIIDTSFQWDRILKIGLDSKDNTSQILTTTMNLTIGKKVMLKSIEGILGRQGLPEQITGSCQTKFINGQGGSKEIPDEIDLATSTCTHSKGQRRILKVIVPPSTKILNYNRDPNTHFFYSVYKFNHDEDISRASWTRSITIENQNSTKNHASKHIILFDYNFNELPPARLKESNKNVQLLMQGKHLNVSLSIPESNGTNVALLLKNRVEIILIKSQSQNQNQPQRNYNTPLEIGYKFLLNPSLGKDVKGSEWNPNVFIFNHTDTYNLNSVKGGRCSDTFIFMGRSKVGKIHGGSDGNNSIILDGKLEGRVTIDMKSRFLRLNHFGYTTNISGLFSHIVGRTMFEEQVIVDCGIRSIDLQQKQIQKSASGFGSHHGRHHHGMDKIVIPQLACRNQFHLGIQVHPSTEITSEYITGSGTSQIIYKISKTKRKNSLLSEEMGNFPNGKRVINISKTSPNALHLIKFEYLPQDFKSLEYIQRTNSIHATVLDDLDLWVNMPKNSEAGIFFILNDFTIVSLDDNDHGKAKGKNKELTFRYNLSASNLKSAIVGGKFNRNNFHVEGKFKSIHGGQNKDIFNFGIDSQVERIDGGGGDDILIFNAEETGTGTGTGTLVNRFYDIDLQNNYIVIHSDSGETKTDLSGTFGEIRAPVFGTKVVNVACSTQFVDLITVYNDTKSDRRNSFKFNREDKVTNIIKIPYNDSSSCEYRILIQLSPDPSEQKIMNSAHKGVFHYLVPFSWGHYFVHRIINKTFLSETQKSKILTNIDTVPDFYHLFKLPGNLSNLNNIAIEINASNSSVFLTLKNGSVSTFTIISSEQVGRNFGVKDPILDSNNFNEDNRNKNNKDHNNNINNTASVVNDDEDLIDILDYSFPFHFLSNDGYEITVNRIGGIHAVKSFNESQLNSRKDNNSVEDGSMMEIIQTNSDLANDLGITIIISILNKTGNPNAIIHIGGDDETDELYNQMNLESHLVGSSFGNLNKFYITPSTENVSVFLYLLEPLRKNGRYSKENDDQNDDQETPTAADDDHDNDNGIDEVQLFSQEDQVNLIDFTSLYDQRENDEDPINYTPIISVPTIHQIGHDLIITASYKNTNAVENDNISPDSSLKTQKVTFVNGVLQHKRMFVKLYSILYEFCQRTAESATTKSNSGKRDSFQWILLPISMEFPSDELDNGEEEEEEEIEDEGGDFTRRRSKRSLDIPINKKATTSGSVTVLTYGDIMEYQIAGESLDIPHSMSIESSEFDPKLSLLSSGDDLIITNNLEKPGIGYHFGFGDADSQNSRKKRSVVIIGMKRAMEKNNFELVLNFGHEKDGKNGREIKANWVNFNQVFPDVSDAEDDLDAYIWRMQIVVYCVTGVLLVLMLMIGSRLLLLLFKWSWKDTFLSGDKKNYKIMQ